MTGINANFKKELYTPLLHMDTTEPIGQDSRVADVNTSSWRILFYNLAFIFSYAPMTSWMWFQYIQPSDNALYLTANLYLWVAPSCQGLLNALIYGFSYEVRQFRRAQKSNVQSIQN